MNVRYWREESLRKEIRKESALLRRALQGTEAVMTSCLLKAILQGGGKGKGQKAQVQGSSFAKVEIKLIWQPDQSQILKGQREKRHRASLPAEK